MSGSLLERNARNQLIFEQRMGLRTLDDIGCEHGVSKERIRQIFWREVRRRKLKHTIYDHSNSIRWIVRERARPDEAAE